MWLLTIVGGSDDGDGDGGGGGRKQLKSHKTGKARTRFGYARGRNDGEQAMAEVEWDIEKL